VRTGNGLIGASFREVPAVAWPEAEALLRRLEPAGLGKFMAVGRPGRPLVGIPVTSGRVGLIVAAGLNPIGALEEEGIETESHAMSAVVDFHQLRPPDMIGDALLTSHRLQRRIARLLDATGKNAPSREAGIFD